MFSFSKKNTIIILKSFSLGGAERQALALAGYLQNERKCTVHIYSYIKSVQSELFYSECERYQLNNLHIVANPLSASGKFKYLKRRIKLFLFGQKLRKHKPDVIIPYLNPPSIIASMVYKIAGARHTFWHHRGEDYYREDLLEQKAAKRIPFLVANSSNGLKELKEKLPVENKKAHYLPNFSAVQPNQEVDVKKIREKLGIQEDVVVVGMVAHFRIEKRQELLLKSCIDLLTQNKIHLVLIGNDSFEKKEESSLIDIRKIIATTELQDKVSVLHNTNSAEILPVFDIGVLLSNNEGMPNAIMEYMAYQKPVLTNAHKGCVALLGEDYGYFVENQQEEVESRLQELVENKELRAALGEQNQVRLHAKFSIENYITELEKLLSV